MNRYKICYRNAYDEDWSRWPFHSIENAMEIFYDKIEIGYDFVCAIQLEDQKIVAYHSKEAFVHFKNTIESELK